MLSKQSYFNDLGSESSKHNMPNHAHTHTHQINSLDGTTQHSVKRDLLLQVESYDRNGMKFCKIQKRLP